MINIYLLQVIKNPVMGVSRGKMPLESNGVGINSRRLPAESVVSAFQHITYTTKNPASAKFRSWVQVVEKFHWNQMESA